MNENKIISETYTIDDFLRDNYKYKIPDFQRSYTWELKEIDDFLSSIFNIYQNKSRLFIGTIYFNQEDGFRFITDGQQRIITYCLMINALRILKNESSNHLVTAASCKVEVYEASTILSKLFTIENIDEINILVEELTELNLTISQIISNQKLIYDRLENVEKLKEVMNYAKNNVEMVFLNLPSHYDEFKIFRDINSKGKPLSNNDIIKSIFFSMILDGKNIPREKQNKYLYWKNIENNLLDRNKLIDGDLSNIKNTLESNLTLSLNMYMSFKIKKFIPTTGFKVSEEYEKNLTQKNATSTLHEICKFTNSIKYVLYPQKLIPSNTTLKICHEFVRALNSLGIKQPLPLFFSIYHQMIEKNSIQGVDKTKILKIIFEKIYIFHFFFSTISSDRPSKIGAVYKRTALEVNRSNLSFEDMFRVLNTNFPNKIELETKVQRILFYVKKRALNSIEDEEINLKEYKIYTSKIEIEYFLILIEFILTKKEVERTEFSGISIETVEHIYNADYNYGKLENFKLMSFLPLENKLNNDCNRLGKNPQLAHKIEIYRESKYLSVKKFVNIYDSLTEKSDVKMRTEWENFILNIIVHRFNELK